MNLLWLLVIILIIFAVVGVPQAGVWHHNFGYYPSGGIGVVVLIVLLILLLR